MAVRYHKVAHKECKGESEIPVSHKPHITIWQVAQALNNLAKLQGRTDGYSMMIVRQVRAAIVDNTPHPLRLWVEDEEQYKRNYLRMN